MLGITLDIFGKKEMEKETKKKKKTLGKTMFGLLRSSHREQSNLSLSSSTTISPEFTCRLLCFIRSFCGAILTLFLLHYLLFLPQDYPSLEAGVGLVVDY